MPAAVTPLGQVGVGDVYALGFTVGGRTRAKDVVIQVPGHLVHNGDHQQASVASAV